MEIKEVEKYQIEELEKGNLCQKYTDKIVLFYQNSVYQVAKQEAEGKIVEFNRWEAKDYHQMEGDVVETIKFEEVYGITKLSKKTYIILVVKSEVVGSIKGYPISKVSQIKLVQIGSTVQQQSLEQALTDSFGLLDFYYSTYDLSQRLQFSYSHPEYYEHSFFCNYKYTLDYDNYPLDLLKKFIFGYSRTKTVESEGLLYRLSLVSRGNFNSMGRRWLRRGINEEGYASTHFQSEIILQIKDNQREVVYSMVQTRGSIPLLWSQTPNLDRTPPFVVSMLQHQILKAMKNYIQQQQTLQNKIKFLSLINKTGKQGILGEAFQNYFNQVRPKNSQLLRFDYAHQYKQHKQQSFNRLIQILRGQLGQYGYFKMQKGAFDYEYEVMKQQKGIVRTNCLDCLDRSNYVQSLIAKVCILECIDQFKGKFGAIYLPLEVMDCQELQRAFKELWKQNANAISKQSAGTQAMKIDYYSNGQASTWGRVRDLTVGIKRYLLGHFCDHYYQNCLDIHFKKLDNSDSNLPLYGLWKKPLGLIASFATIGGLSYGAYRLMSFQLQEYVKNKFLRQVASISLSLVTAYNGLRVIKRNNHLYVGSPIIKREYY